MIVAWFGNTADATSGTGNDSDFAAQIETHVHDASAASEEDRDVLSTIAKNSSPASKQTAASACKPTSTP